MDIFSNICKTLLRTLANLWILFLIWFLSDKILKNSPNSSEIVKYMIWSGGTCVWITIIDVIPRIIDIKIIKFKEDLKNHSREERLETINYIQSWVRPK